MKKILLLGAAVLSLCFQGLAKSNVTTESRAVGAAFEKIASDGVFDLVLTQGSSDAVSVEVDEEWQKYVTVEVKNGTLNLSTSREFGKKSGRDRSCKVYVMFENINALQVSGVGNVETKNAIKSERLEVRVSGVGNAKLELEVKQASVNVSGVGNTTLKGVAEELQLRNSGVGNLDASDLKAEKVDVTNSGVGNAKVYASKFLSINNSSVGSITYSGPAVITSVSSSGVGKIKKND